MSFTITIPKVEPESAYWPRFFAADIKPVLPRMILSMFLITAVIVIGFIANPLLAWIALTMLLVYIVVWTKAFFKNRAAFRLLMRTIHKGEAKFSADDEGFTYSADGNESRLEWRDVTHTSRTKDYLVIMSGGLSLALIPTAQLSREQIKFFETRARKTNAEKGGAEQPAPASESKPGGKRET